MDSSSKASLAIAATVWGLILFGFLWVIDEGVNLFFVIVWVVGSLFIFLMMRFEENKEKKKQDFATKYESALTALEQNPTSPDLRKKALHAGRERAMYLRSIANPQDQGQLTIFDETSIKNDIDAACAGAVPSSSLSDELIKLHKLEQEGVISKDDIEKLKGKITGNPDSVDQAIRLLRGLGDLYREGALTQGEFNIKKWDVLSRKLMK